MKANRGPLTPAETALILQGTVEGLNPQQVLARDLLVEHLLEELVDADEYVRRVGPELSATLKETLACAVDVCKAYYQFQDMTGNFNLRLVLGP